jgi:hypothetical protein
MLAPSPNDPLKWHNDAILVEDRQSGLLIDLDDALASELADILVPTRRNSGATIFPGQESGRGNTFPALPAVAVARDKLTVTIALPEPVNAASTLFMIKAALSPLYSARSLRFERLSNGNVNSKLRTSGVLPPTAVDTTITDIP